MSVFIGEKNKRVELAERKDATNPNLLLNSRDFSANWVIGNATVTSDSYNGGKVVSVHANGDGSTDVRQQIQTLPSQALTWSVYAKATNAGDKLHTELFGGGGRTDQALTTDWNRYTFHGTPDPTNTTLYFWGVNGNKGDIYIALPKLEIGNTATPWCPALEDYAWESDITNLQNTVNQLEGRQTVDAPDFNTLTDSGVYYITNLQNGKNYPTTNWGQLVVFSSIASGTAIKTTQIYVPDYSTDIFARIYGWTKNGTNNVQAWGSWDQIAWKSDITNLQNTIQANKTANKTDITNVQSMITGLSTKVDSLQQNSLKIVPITQAAYDALSTKDPNTIYAIGG